MEQNERAELFGRAVERLQMVWEKNLNDLDWMHDRRLGIRSTQIGALLLMLIGLGVITHEGLDEAIWQDED